MIRRATLVVIALAFAAAGCRSPDVTVARGDIDASAARVCAAPPMRPAYGTRSRAPTPAELDAALQNLCRRGESLAVADLAIVDAALADDRAVVGYARRSQMMIRAARIDESLRITQVDAGAGCDPGNIAFELKLFDAITVSRESKALPAALAMCADALALAREAMVAGNMTDATLAFGTLERFSTTCKSVLDEADEALAKKHASDLRALRASFPSSLRDVAGRDRDEMILVRLGPLRDRTRTLACARAEALAEIGDTTELSRSDRARLVDAWNVERNQPTTDGLEKYETAYRDALKKVDATLAR